jgi:hypothetical protein
MRRALFVLPFNRPKVLVGERSKECRSVGSGRSTWFGAECRSGERVLCRDTELGMVHIRERVEPLLVPQVESCSISLRTWRRAVGTTTRMSRSPATNSLDAGVTSATLSMKPEAARIGGRRDRPLLLRLHHADALSDNSKADDQRAPNGSDWITRSGRR